MHQDASDRRFKKARHDNGNGVTQLDSMSAAPDSFLTSSSHLAHGIDLASAPPEVLPYIAETEGFDEVSGGIAVDEESGDVQEGEIGLAHEGVGEDDEEDEEEQGDSSPNINGRTHRIPKPFPAWLQNEFNRLVHASGPENQYADGRPPLYHDLETFYFPRPAKFFLLT
ncbi:hypothetical protein GYMLUDRAFT_261500 [Collybiopsis luxurians FD-317 M1]|uniref:Uncharacterized protein n=1 Tax=Collybiopsis luxurians FD-317 M1 TaxID=944289 RepID=A0A0D0BXV1_9AGAR|nr:hypothetical protein GYMLUDRAFT_261500 [Collybiopsis luxurians FD-317 M1]